jgi:hypothetical protein
MRSDRLLELIGDDHARSFCSRSAREEHDSRSGICKGTLQQADRNRHGYTRTPLSALIVRYWPRVSLQLLNDGCELILHLFDWQQEACGRARRWPALGWTHTLWSVLERCEVKHVLDLLCRVLFCASEDVRFRTVAVAELMYVRLCARQHGP